MSYNFTLIYNRQRPQNKTALIHGVRDNVPIIWYMLHYIEIHDDVNTSITGFPLELHWRLSIITKNVDVFALWLLRIYSYIRILISFLLIFSFDNPELVNIPKYKLFHNIEFCNCYQSLYWYNGKGLRGNLSKIYMKFGSLHQCNDKIWTKEDVNL